MKRRTRKLYRKLFMADAGTEFALTRTSGVFDERAVDALIDRYITAGFPEDPYFFTLEFQI